MKFYLADDEGLMHRLYPSEYCDFKENNGAYDINYFDYFLNEGYHNEKCEFYIFSKGRNYDSLIIEIDDIPYEFPFVEKQIIKD